MPQHVAEIECGRLLAPDELTSSKRGAGIFVKRQIGKVYHPDCWECEQFDTDQLLDNSVVADSRDATSTLLPGQMDATATSIVQAAQRNYTATFHEQDGALQPIADGVLQPIADLEVGVAGAPKPRPKRRRKTLFDDGSDDDWFDRGAATPSAAFLESIVNKDKPARVPKERKPRVSTDDAPPKPKRRRLTDGGVDRDKENAGDATDRLLRTRAATMRTEHALNSKIAENDAAELKLEELLYPKLYSKAVSGKFDTDTMMPDKLKLPFAKLLKAKNDDTMKAKFNTDSGYPDLVLNYFSQLDALIDSYISFGRLTNAAKSFADDLDVIADAQESYILCVNAFAKLRGLNPIYEARLPSIILSDIFVEQARCMWQLLCRHSCGDTSVAVSFDIDTSLRAVFYPDEARELWSSIFPTAVNAPDRFKVVTRADVGAGYANHCDTVGLMLNVAIAMCGHDFADAKFIKSFVTGLVALPVCVPPAAVTATDTALASADALGVQPLSEVEVELPPDAQPPLSPLSPPSGDSPPVQAELFSGVIPTEHCPAIDCINTLVCTDLTSGIANLDQLSTLRKDIKSGSKLLRQFTASPFGSKLVLGIDRFLTTERRASSVIAKFIRLIDDFAENPIVIEFESSPSHDAVASVIAAAHTLRTGAVNELSKLPHDERCAFMSAHEHDDGVCKRSADTINTTITRIGSLYASLAFKSIISVTIQVRTWMSSTDFHNTDEPDMEVTCAAFVRAFDRAPTVIPDAKTVGIAQAGTWCSLRIITSYMPHLWVRHPTSDIV